MFRRHFLGARFEGPRLVRERAESAETLPRRAALFMPRPPEMTILAAVSSGRSDLESSSEMNSDLNGPDAAPISSISAEPPSPTFSKVVGRTVMTFLASEDFTVIIALPA